MKRLFASLLVLAALLVLIVGCGGGGGGSSSSGGSTSGSSSNIPVSGHLSYTVGTTDRAYAASTTPQTVRLLVGTNTVTLNNAMVTTDLRPDASYAFLNAGSKPINGTRSSSTMSTIVNSVSYDVPLNPDGTTTRPLLAYFGQTTYPVSQIGNLEFPNGIQISFAALGDVPGNHTADLEGTCKIDQYGQVSGTARFTFTGGGVGSAGLSWSAGVSSIIAILASSATSPVTETFSGGVPTTSDRSFTTASITYTLP